MLWWTLRQLKSSNHHTRRNAVKDLARFKNPNALQAAIAALQDPHYAVRDEAVRTLGNLQNGLAVQPLMRYYKSLGAGNWTGHKEVIQSLGKIPDFASVENLIQISEAEYAGSPESLEALQSLIKIGSDKALDYVFGKAKQGVDEPVADALLMLKSEKVSQIVKEGLLARLSQGRLTKGLYDRLISLGWNPSTNQDHIQVAMVMGEYEKAAGYGRDSVDSLLRVLSKEMDMKTRPAEIERIVVLLGKIGDEKAIARLSELLRQNIFEHLHEKVIRALANIGNTKALPAILASLRSCRMSYERGHSGVPGDRYFHNRDLWNGSVEIIKNWGAPCLDPLLQYAMQEDGSIRVALPILQMMADPTLLHKLIPLVSSDSATHVELAIELIDSVLNRCAAEISVENLRSIRQLERPTALVTMDTINRWTNIKEKAQSLRP